MSELIFMLAAAIGRQEAGLHGMPTPEHDRPNG